MLAVVHRHGLALRYSSELLRMDKDVVLSAVRQHGAALEYTSEVLQQDKEVVMAAVRSWGHSLRYAGHVLKGDADVVSAAMETDCVCFRWASQHLREDRSFVSASIRRHGLAALAASALAADPELLAEAQKAFPAFALPRKAVLRQKASHGRSSESQGHQVKDAETRRQSVGDFVIAAKSWLFARASRTCMDQEDALEGEQTSLISGQV